ncbi:MAG TPA: GxxExxY protein [Tepidisphaeraceae bacterium]
MNTDQNGLILSDQSYAIIGAAMAVHNELNAGFAEAVYQEAMEIELAARGVPFERQVRLRVNYKGRQLEAEFIADLICYGTTIVELKAVREKHKYFEAQIINYLRATGLKLGLIINFGDPGRLDWQRFVR